MMVVELLGTNSFPPYVVKESNSITQKGDVFLNYASDRVVDRLKVGDVVLYKDSFYRIHKTNLVLTFIAPNRITFHLRPVDAEN